MLKREEAAANPQKHLEEKVVELQAQLEGERFKSGIKRNTLIQNRALILKNQTFTSEIAELKDKDEDRKCLCNEMDIERTETELKDALERESKLIADITKLTADKDKFLHGRM